MSLGKYALAKQYITYRYTRELVRRSNTTDLSIKELIEGESEYWNTENSNKNAKNSNNSKRLFSRNYINRHYKKILASRGNCKKLMMKV